MLAIVREATLDELPALVGKLAEAQAVALARLTTPAANRATTDEDANLSATEAARRLGVSRDWLYKSKVPFRVRIGRRVLFSARGLERWNRQRLERS